MTSIDKPHSELDLKFSESAKRATERRAQFMAAIPRALSEQEDAVQRRLAAENAAPKTKLRKIYRLADELIKVATPYVACGKGCSSCCHMNVSISAMEAEHIERETGLKAVPISASRRHPRDKFIGAPCPFLRNSVCSIYEARPLACRMHLSFDDSPFWCHPSRALTRNMPMIEFSGVKAAFFDLSRATVRSIFADIRDYFPVGLPANVDS